jgi:hypothetical protein
MAKVNTDSGSMRVEAIKAGIDWDVQNAKLLENKRFAFRGLPRGTEMLIQRQRLL